MFIITANKYTQDWQPPKAPSTKIGKKNMDSSTPKSFFFEALHINPIPKYVELRPQMWSVFTRISKDKLEVLLCNKYVDLLKLPLQMRIVDSNKDC
jgi:hypothetical protein